MQIVNEWEARGICRGQAAMVLRFLGGQFGELPAPLQERINELPEPTLESLVDSLREFTSVAQVEEWLVSNS